MGAACEYRPRDHRTARAPRCSIRPVRREPLYQAHVPRARLVPTPDATGRGYRAIGYARGKAPLGYAEPRDERIVEYDDDVLRALDHESATDWGDDAEEWEP
jgi:hypothetical protein